MAHPHEGYPLGDTSRPQSEAIEAQRQHDEWMQAIVDIKDSPLVEEIRARVLSDPAPIEYPTPQLPDLTQITRAADDYTRAEPYLKRSIVVGDRTLDFAPVKNISDDVFSRHSLLYMAALDANVPAVVCQPAINERGTIVADNYYALGAPRGTEKQIDMILSHTGPGQFYIENAAQVHSLQRAKVLLRGRDDIPPELSREQVADIKRSAYMTSVALDFKYSLELENYHPGSGRFVSLNSEIEAFNRFYNLGFRPHSIEAILGLAARAVDWALQEGEK